MAPHASPSASTCGRSCAASLVGAPPPSPAPYLVLALTGASPPILAIGFVLAGLGIGCVETAEHAAVARLVPQEPRGSAFGLLATVRSLGNLAASATAGLLRTLVSPTAAFLYAAAWMLVALVALAGRTPPAI